MKPFYYYTLGLLLALVASPGQVFGDDGLKFKAELTGAQEIVFDAGTGAFVPGGVATNALGKIKARFDKGFTKVDVDLRVSNSAGVFDRAHFHCGRPGQNGPIPFGLVNPGPLVFDGGEVEGTLTNADFTGADCEPVIGRPVDNIASLAFAMLDGLIYTNVHSTAFPAGEIRGQMLAD